MYQSYPAYLRYATGAGCAGKSAARTENAAARAARRAARRKTAGNATRPGGTALAIVGVTHQGPSSRVHRGRPGRLNEVQDVADCRDAGAWRAGCCRVVHGPGTEWVGTVLCAVYGRRRPPGVDRSEGGKGSVERCHVRIVRIVRIVRRERSERPNDPNARTTSITALPP